MTGSRVGDSAPNTLNGPLETEDCQRLDSALNVANGGGVCWMDTARSFNERDANDRLLVRPYQLGSSVPVEPTAGYAKYASVVPVFTSCRASSGPRLFWLPMAVVAA
jgi:hypothetical protein